MDVSGGSPFRRIDFHPERKPYEGFTKEPHMETLNSTNGNLETRKISVSDPSVKKGVGSVFLDNGLDSDFSFRINFRQIGAGLQNLGNTCFLNSVLQCLTYTEPLAAYLQSGKHQTSCRTAGFCALCAIQSHVSRALQSTGRILAPKDLVSNLRCISRNFRNSRQEDAHEYMVNLLESMHKCCLPSGVPSESPTAYEKSLVHRIFGGQLRSQVKCMQCSSCSDKFDPFIDLSLEIIKADTLLKALTHFTSKEQLDGGERQYQCQQCKQKVKAVKQLTVHRAPQVLTLHLKRFGSHWTEAKIDKQIQFGSTLDLKPFISGSYEGDLKYTLYGVLVHAGWSIHSGHYFCFVRTSSGMWHFLDDNRVVPVGERKVLDQKAYMLFYVRDKKIRAPKIPIDITQKNAAAKGMGSGTRTNSIPLKGSIQIIENGNMSNSHNSLAAASGDSSNVWILKEISTDGSTCKKNDLMPECLTEKFPVPNLAGQEIIPEPISLAVGSDVPLDDSKITKPCVEMPNSSDKSSIKKNLDDNIRSANCNGHEGCIGGKEPLESIVQSPNHTEETTKKTSDISAMPSNLSITQTSNIEKCIMDQKILYKTDVETSAKDFVKKPGEEQTRTDHRIIEDAKIEDELKCADKFSGKDGRENRTELSHQEIGKHLSSKRKVIYIKPLHKLNKKRPRCQVTGLYLGSNMLVRAALGMRKVKKHKWSKKHALEKKRRHFSETDLVQIDIGPSTSGKMDGINSAELVVEERTKNVYRAASGDKSSSVVESRGGAMQNNLMNLLTRGLAETTVARWDGIELRSYQAAASSYAESTSIGYIGDEWDEEYDKSKRKKLRRSRTTFEGPNLFQDIETKKAAIKKRKLDKSSGNQPFRI